MSSRPSTAASRSSSSSATGEETAADFAAAGDRELLLRERMARRLAAAAATGSVDLSDPREASALRFALEEVPEEVLEQAEGVRELWLTNNALGVLAAPLFRAPLAATLTTLGLGGNLLRAVPPEIARLGALERLLLERNLLESVPASLSELRGLRELRLDGNRLRRFPTVVTHIRGLQRLGLSGNELPAVPPDVRRLTNLIELDLDHNRIGPDVPAELGRLHNLRVLGLAHNRLEAFPEPVRLLRLDMLRVAGNRKAGFEVLDAASGLAMDENDCVIPVRKDGFYRYVERPPRRVDQPRDAPPNEVQPLEGLVPYAKHNDNCAAWVADEWNDARAVLRARARGKEWRTENRLGSRRRRR